MAAPPDTLGVERWTPHVSLIGSWTFLPTLALEPRGTIMLPRSDDPGLPRLEIVHVEFNLTWSPLYQYRIAPFLTAGFGGVRMHHTNALAANAGGGALFRLRRNLGLRIDARDEAYHIPLNPSTEFHHGLEVFAGFTVGLGPWKIGDRDGDGIPDDVDRCPDTPPGAIVNDDGCPVDGDGDGVPDGIDQCIATPPGVRVDTRGCPLDSDGDGIFDGLDRCPDTPRGALVDPTGCPIDADMDGVPDGLDQCAGTPRGCRVDATGCEHDADQDGVCDGRDSCADTPAGTRVNEHGCPMSLDKWEQALLTAGVIRIDDHTFEPGTAVITTDAQPALDEVAGVLARWPQLQIQIGVWTGTTDSMVSRAEAVRQLSESRARAVLVFMVDRFPTLRSGRFKTVGLGGPPAPGAAATPPIASDHGTIEFRLLNPEVMRKEAERMHLLAPH